MVPVTVEDGQVWLEDRAIGLIAQGAANGKARLFVRPYEIDVVLAANAALSRHGQARARRWAPAPACRGGAVGGTEPLVEIDAGRASCRQSEPIGLRPQRWKLFAEAGALAVSGRSRRTPHTLKRRVCGRLLLDGASRDESSDLSGLVPAAPSP